MAATTTPAATAPAKKMLYTQPWAWVVGAAILLVIILLATKGSKNTSSPDKVIVTKTVKRDIETIQFFLKYSLLQNMHGMPHLKILSRINFYKTKSYPEILFIQFNGTEIVFV